MSAVEPIHAAAAPKSLDELLAARVVDILGTPVHALTMTEVLDIADAAVAERRRLLFGVVNAAKLVNMRRDAVLRDSVLSADLVLADGMSVVWAARLLGRPLPERVSGIDLMMCMLERGSERGYRIYCLGASDDVLQTAVARIRQDYPGLIIAGCRDGYFGEADEPQVAEEIAAARPDFLFVAISSPKKERFLARWGDKMNVPICHGVGGTFDVMAGKVRRAPRAWQKMGLEWLYRVWQEPGRMWRRYLVTNTFFLGMLLRELIGSGRARSKQSI
ncbi:MAG: WecB/TagA/CpsF family glycosyltransferase [Planctomycetes bacterium]|nr:WecB/TagA/CpsF family glycosyltransferase [Planctomycetota bacterium]